MKIALLGNPNTGKSSVFNLLTGMRQHVGNFPGVTVDKKSGSILLENEKAELIDFPGTYSIYPRSRDERVVYKSLCDKNNPDYPDAVFVVVDASNLERNLLLFSQVYDLQLPIVMLLNMTDLAIKRNKRYNVEELRELFPEAKIIETNARAGTGKQRILEAAENIPQRHGHSIIENYSPAPIDDHHAQDEEANHRFKKIKDVMHLIEEKLEQKHDFSRKVDRIIVHPVLGYLIFALILLTIFQAIYSFAQIPMDYIDGWFNQFGGWVGSSLPEGVFTDLLSQGIIPGIGGVVVFIPQIALLFFFIAILEETGYLSRVVFIMDRLMRPLGLNGKSVVPLLSSVACAIPGIMSARTISDWKERTITILVAPLMSCSARIPVYTLLIALVIPDERIWGFMNVRGLVLFGLYALGLISALLIAFILKWLINTKEKGFLLLEMPSYKAPKWSNVGIKVWEKVHVFVLDAGKIILAISIVLWALATYGPTERMKNAEIYANELAIKKNLNGEQTNQLIASEKLESSYMGILGKSIEPVISPLGYDWKIGISLITSFAAREVFVGSMATIYSVQEDGKSNLSLIQKLRREKRKDGSAVYTLASGTSLMVFYVFAMQCMATMAVVKRETKSWKWPLIQLGYMGVLAYLLALVTFNILT